MQIDSTANTHRQPVPKRAVREAQAPSRPDAPRDVVQLGSADEEAILQAYGAPPLVAVGVKDRALVDALLDAPAEPAPELAAAPAVWTLDAKTLEQALATDAGERLDGLFKEQGIDLRDAAGIDMSPEAVSERIFGFASGMFGVFREQNPELSDEEAVDEYERVIGDAVTRGFEEAMEILEGMGIADQARETAEETIGLLRDKLDQFFTNLRT